MGWDWVGYLLGPTLRAPYGANKVKWRCSSKMTLYVAKYRNFYWPAD